MHSNLLTNVESVEKFAKAGNATLTLVSKKTGARFTYKIRKPDMQKPFWFVSLMTGTDNNNDFSYLGQIFQNSNFGHGKKSKIGSDAPSNKGFEYFWNYVNHKRLPENVEVWHEGRCGRCGRKLTVPESIETGFGPECAGKI